MSRGWQKSELEIGTRVKIPADLFIEPYKAQKRLLHCAYIGDTNAGIIVDCVFKPACNAPDPSLYHYRIHINWASIWCGDVKVRLNDGSLLRAKRITS